MKSWEVRRHGKYLGKWIAEDLRIRDGTLYAVHRSRVIGAIASGPGLTWHGISIAEAWKDLDRVTLRIWPPAL